ncbi:MAG: VWA domain-containing protein [Methylococcaceae bacterium]|nr:MAG: VWA domain-containing protein [Methylococcaceae bacterium]
MDLTQFHFIRPWWLLALIPFIGGIWTLWRSNVKQARWSQVCDAELLPYLLHANANQVHLGQREVLGAVVVLAIIALAGPTMERIQVPAFSNAAALVIVLDLSHSMDAKDITPSRLLRARYKIADILKQRKDGQTALVVYAGEAFTVTPLTTDTETINNQLSALQTDIMPSQGSDTGLALQRAMMLLKQAGSPLGQIILVTDGIDDAAFAIAQTLGDVHLSVLGIGTVEGAPIPLAEGGFLKDAQGSIVIPKLDIAQLAKLANTGHGSYQTSTANDEDIQQLMRAINRSMTDVDSKNTTLQLAQWSDLGPWLAVLIVPFAAILFRKGVLVFALLCFLPMPKTSYALTWQDVWQTADQQAQQAYKQQDYAKAAELFVDPKWKSAAYYQAGEYAKAAALGLKSDSDSADFYNQANALAQAGKLQEAVAGYEHALKLNPNNADAKYNKEIVEKELDKEREKQQKNDDQQKSSEQNSNNQDKQSSSQQQNKPSSSQQSDINSTNESSSEQDTSGSPEQKPEHPDLADKPPPASDKDHSATEEKKTAQQQSEAAEKNAASEKNKSSAKPAVAEQADLSAEQKQANEQWLKRIPDDPAGLLKRKFLYQYGQQEYLNKNSTQAW